MSEFKGSRGPWEYSTILSASENHKGYNIWQPVDGGRHGSFVAEVSPRDQDGIEGEANARLIAAAPDLLKACDDLLRNSFDEDDTSSDDHLIYTCGLCDAKTNDDWLDVVHDPDCSVGLARAAIKKALGDE